MIRIYQIFLIAVTMLLQCSCQKNASPKPDYTGQKDSLIDIDGNKYKAIGIGSQIWMQENLKVTRLSDGTKILVDESSSYSFWRDKNSLTPALCWYDNDSINKPVYGGLYNFFAIQSGLLCPTGWHVPTMEDWNTLIDFLGGAEIAGGKLKTQNNWYPPNHLIDNIFNFQGLPGGFRFSETGDFREKGLTAKWWANKIYQYDSLKVFSFTVQNDQITLTQELVYRNGGESVRCIKD